MNIDKIFLLFRYDEEERYLYTKSLLTDFIQPRLVKLVINNEEKCFQFTVLNLVRQEKIGNIFDFINGKTPIRPRDSIRIIETLFKQTVPDQYICVRNKYYDRSQTLLDLSSFLFNHKLKLMFNHSKNIFRRWKWFGKWLSSSSLFDLFRSNDKRQFGIYLFLSTNQFR